MAEKVEFDVLVKSNTLDKALEQSITQAQDLEQGLKQAIAVLNKPTISGAFQSSLKQNNLLVDEFREGSAAAFAIAKKGADDASKSAKDLGKEIKNSEESAFSFGNILKSASSFFLGNILYDSFSKITSALREAVNESISFKRAQLEIETILPKNEKLTAGLVKQLEELSNQYGSTPTSQAKAYYEIISAGVTSAADGAKLLTRANELATGGVTDTANTIDLLTTVYNVYGKEIATATEASDSLFKTVQLGKTTIAELSQDLGQALPIAKSFGIGLDEVGAILAQLTNSGISTSESVTLLNAVLTAIARNGEALGVGMNSAAVQTDGLGVVLDRLKERTNGSNDALFKLLGRQEAVRAVQSLTSKGLEGYNATLAEYANKAGVASDASEKIIDNDLGKQFSILGSNIANAGRSIIDVFTPAVLSAVQSLNGFSTLKEQQENAVSTSVKVAVLRKEIEKLGESYNAGKIFSSNYQTELAKLQERLAALTNTLPTAENPLVTILSGAKSQASELNNQIDNLKLGFDGLKTIGPIEASLKIESLTQKLKSVNAEIGRLSAPPPEQPIAETDTRTQEQIDKEKTLQAEIFAIRQQFSIEDQKLKDDLYIQNIDKEAVRAQADLDATFAYESKKLENSTQLELEKTAMLKTEGERRLAAEKVIADAQLKASKIQQDYEKKANELKIKDKKLTEQEYQTILSNSLSVVSGLQESGNKSLVAVGKAAALAQLSISAPVAVGKALELGPIIGPIAATAMTVAFAAQAAKIAGVKFEDGGIVGGANGASVGPDNRIAQIRDGEMILNAQEQKYLFDGIKSGSLGGGQIIVQIDGREIARAVRDQLKQGFQLA
jgi:TP901 family phage tail tape measure protein